MTEVNCVDVAEKNGGVASWVIVVCLVLGLLLISSVAAILYLLLIKGTTDFEL